MDERLLIPTKITIPHRSSEVLRRQRLLDFIHEHLDRKLIIVSAPAGYGKTTLLVDFSTDTEIPVCWYTLDEGDRDLGVFLAYLTASLRRRFPDFGHQTHQLLEQGTITPRRAAGAVVADIVESIPDYFACVLDDWHLVNDSPEIVQFLDRLLHYLPEQAHLIVAGRSLPRASLIRLAARREVAGLGPNDLRFTAEEVQHLLATYYRIQVSLEQAAQLAEESEGWITGILLTTHTMWQGLLASLLQGRSASVPLYEYLAGEVYAQQSPEMRDFLLASAVPRQVTAALCDHLRQAEDSQEWLDRVEGRNLFLTRIEAEGEVWYRYHNLFQSFLRNRFQQESPTRFREMHRRAGEWFEEQNHPEEAVEHYLAATAYDEAIRVIEACVQDFFTAGRTGTILAWAEALPQAVRKKAPELLLYQAKVLSDRGRADEALTVLERAEIAFKARNSPLGQARVLLQRGWALLLRNRYGEAVESGKQAYETLITLGEADTPLTADALRLIGFGRSYQGEFQEGEQYLTQALQLYERIGEAIPFNLARVLQDLAYTLLRQGRLPEAATYQERALALWREIGSPGPLAWNLNNTGYNRYLTGDYQDALALYQEALPRAEEAEDRYIQVVLLAGIGDVQRDTGQFDAALEAYRRAEEMARQGGNVALIAYLLDAQGHLHRLRGDLNQAQVALSQAEALAREHGLQHQALLSAAALALVRIEAEQAQEVTPLLHARDALQEANARLELVRVLFWLAQAAFRREERTVARSSLQQLLRLSREVGAVPFSPAEGRHALALLRWAKREELPEEEARYLVTWLERIQERPSRAAAPTSEKRPRLEIYGFGPGRVLRDGELIPIAAWGAAIARELFFFILDQAPLRKEQIGVVFWPGLPPGRMTSAFHATKYKARRALGVEFVVYEEGLYHVHLEADWWYDVAEFERLVRTARRLPLEDPEGLEARRRAIALYQGDYLEDVYADWAAQRRRALQEEFLEVLAGLARHMLEAQEPEEALRLYRRGLRMDPYREDFHRGVMRALIALGRRAEALAHFDALTRQLDRELHTTPDPETVALGERLRSHPRLQP